jgi:hypothetical protein
MKTHILVQIHPIGPNRIKHEKANYRLYINDDLIAERTWIWNKLTFIEENLSVDIPYGDHCMRLEVVKANPGHISKFALRDLRIKNQTIDNIEKETTELNFKTYKYNILEKTYENIRFYQRRIRK